MTHGEALTRRHLCTVHCAVCHRALSSHRPFGFPFANFLKAPPPASSRRDGFASLDAGRSTRLYGFRSPVGAVSRRNGFRSPAGAPSRLNGFRSPEKPPGRGGPPGRLLNGAEGRRGSPPSFSRATRRL